jgi:hypothetical protein
MGGMGCTLLSIWVMEKRINRNAYQILTIRALLKIF